MAKNEYSGIPKAPALQELHHHIQDIRCVESYFSAEKQSVCSSAQTDWAIIVRPKLTCIIDSPSTILQCEITISESSIVILPLWFALRPAVFTAARIWPSVSRTLEISFSLRGLPPPFTWGTPNKGNAGHVWVPALLPDPPKKGLVSHSSGGGTDDNYRSVVILHLSSCRVAHRPAVFTATWIWPSVSQQLKISFGFNLTNCLSIPFFFLPTKKNLSRFLVYLPLVHWFSKQQ